MLEDSDLGQLPLGFEKANSIFGMTYTQANFLERYQCNSCYQREGCDIRRENSMAAANNYPYWNESFSFLGFDIPYEGEDFTGFHSGNPHLVCRDFKSIDSVLQLEFDFGDKYSKENDGFIPVVRHIYGMLKEGKLVKKSIFDWKITIS